MPPARRRASRASPAAMAMLNSPRTPNENHDFTAGYGFDRQDRDSDSLDRNRLERENYSLSHNGRWDIGNSELKFYGEKVDNKNPRAERDYYLGKQCHRRQVCPAAGHD